MADRQWDGATLSVECFDGGLLPWVMPGPRYARVSPRVDYKSEQRPYAEWRTAVENAFRTFDGNSDIRVLGRAPHAVYAWIGMNAGPGRRVVFPSGGDEYVWRGGRAQGARLADCHESVFPVTSGVHHLFLGLATHTVTDADRAAIEDVVGLAIGSETVARLPAGNVTPENFAALADAVEATVEHVVSLRQPGEMLLVTFGVPLPLAAAAGLRLRAQVCRAHVQILEKTGPARYRVCM